MWRVPTKGELLFILLYLLTVAGLAAAAVLTYKTAGR